MPGNYRLTETVVSLAESLSQAVRESAATVCEPCLSHPLYGGEDKAGRGGMSTGIWEAKEIVQEAKSTS